MPDYGCTQFAVEGECPHAGELPRQLVEEAAALQSLEEARKRYDTVRAATSRARAAEQLALDALIEAEREHGRQLIRTDEALPRCELAFTTDTETVVWWMRACVIERTPGTIAVRVFGSRQDVVLFEKREDAWVCSAAVCSTGATWFVRGVPDEAE